MSDPIRDGIQKLLDMHDDGWNIAHYVAAMGLERIVDGRLEHTSWSYWPPDQAPYVTKGLVEDALDVVCAPDESDL